jgi:folylpolyglutamate synthase/dihydropteroate synthase
LLGDKNTTYLCSKIISILTKIVLTYCEKKNSSDREKLLKFEAEGREFSKHFEITTTIYSNSDRSEKFLVRE